MRNLTHLANQKIQILFEIASNLENLRNVRGRRYIMVLQNLSQMFMLDPRSWIPGSDIFWVETVSIVLQLMQTLWVMPTVSKCKYTRQSEIQPRKQSILEKTQKYKATGNLFGIMSIKNQKYKAVKSQSQSIVNNSWQSKIQGVQIAVWAMPKKHAFSQHRAAEKNIHNFSRLKPVNIHSEAKIVTTYRCQHEMMVRPVKKSYFLN